MKAMEVAVYFLRKDTDGTVFDNELIERNGRRFYRGNARLNKYLHMAQNLWIARTGEKLFDDDLYAYDNGAVATEVQENYAVLKRARVGAEMPDDVAAFLDKIYAAFANADIDELIELSHEDSAWVDKHNGYTKGEQRMDSLAHAGEYREQYRDMLKVLDRMRV